MASCRWRRASPTESAEAAGREKAATAWSRRTTEEDNATAARAALFLQDDGSIVAKKRGNGSKAAFSDDGPFYAAAQLILRVITSPAASNPSPLRVIFYRAALIVRSSIEFEEVCM